MQVIFLIIIGIAAGFVATRLMKVEADPITTIAVGILGALIGGAVLRFLLVLTGVAAGFIGAVLGAILLIWLWRVLTDKG
ncbi:MAG: GlsB/YeaQ/YmgE family stress response membrane protein [Alphaproteobacteria bacterium]|nr:MAG: GlsB/YeaQ/YmgE family stress response membrane protein [Alphaproteobacteria bacterium]